VHFTVILNGIYVKSLLLVAYRSRREASNEEVQQITIQLHELPKHKFASVEYALP